MSAQTVAKDRMPDSGVGLDGRRRILIVDDDRDFAEALEDLLVSHGYDVVTAHSPATALETEADFAPDVALIDVRLGQSSGMDLVEAIKDRRPDIVCIMVTAYANVETAVDAMRHGADDYLRKPVETAELFATLERGFATRQLLQDKRVAEDKLSASEERFRGMVENSPAAIFLKDLEGRYRLVNRRFEEWYGVSAADAVGRTSYDVYPKAYADSYTALDREVLETGQSREQELDAPFADGSVHRIIVNKFPVFGTDGQVIGLGSVNTDVTEQRAAEAQLRQAQKMEAVGRLTGGVAHDFNNLLAVILGNLEILDEELQGDGNLHDLISAAVRAATRGGELTHRLLAFSRRQPLSPVVTDLNRHVMEMSDLLRRTLGETIKVEIALGADLRRTRADPAELEAALINLAFNARDAMPGGGTLTIETADADLDETYAAAHEEVTAGPYLMLSISDCGHGMAPEVRAQAIDPFFTTKEVGEGSGLGLSMVYGFVKQSGGHVEIESEPGQGTTVRLYFPECDEEEAPSVKPEPGDATPKGVGESILVVEDDPDLRELAESIISGLGYQVRAVANAVAALGALGERPDIDLLFTDVVLPGGTSGAELARQAQVRCPTLKVVYTSGYPENVIEAGGELDEDVVLIAKPYRKAILARQLRWTLDGNGGSA
jgi:PAS domain S-box-containing protein